MLCIYSNKVLPHSIFSTTNTIHNLINDMIKSYSINNKFTHKARDDSPVGGHIASFDWLRHFGPRMITYVTAEM
jgi:hypothetical protein